MLAQVAQRRLDQRSRRRAHQHLTAVPRSRYPRRAMHIRTDIPLVRHQRRSGVHAHPDMNQPGPQPLRDQPRRLQRVRSPREGQKERVTLRIDLRAAKRCTRLTHHPPMLPQHPGIRIRTELVEQPRRALHISEHERHRPRGQTRPHPRIMRQFDGEVTNRSQSARGVTLLVCASVRECHPAAGPVTGARIPIAKRCT